VRLAVSNIAWSPESRRQAYALLIENGIGGLEVAPGLLFREAVDPFDPTEAEARSVRDELDGSGLELVSMQSLLFGVQGAALFEGPGPLTRLRFGMDRAIAFAERFSIPNMVFGCPLQRAVPVGMDHSEALKFGAEQFRKMGDRAASAGTVIAVEFNPEAYGTNFLNTVEQAQAFVT
jgi:sugar phosphate isomerase/epimerase